MCSTNSMSYSVNSWSITYLATQLPAFVEVYVYIHCSTIITWSYYVIRTVSSLEMKIRKGIPTDLDWRYKTAVPFSSRHGAPVGVFGFSHNQNNPDLSGTYVTCIYMYCMYSKREDKHAWKVARRASMKIMGTFCLHLFPHVFSARI